MSGRIVRASKLLPVLMLFALAVSITQMQFDARTLSAESTNRNDSGVNGVLHSNVSDDISEEDECSVNLVGIEYQLLERTQFGSDPAYALAARNGFENYGNKGPDPGLKKCCEWVTGWVYRCKKVLACEENHDQTQDCYYIEQCGYEKTTVCARRVWFWQSC